MTSWDNAPANIQCVNLPNSPDLNPVDYRQGRKFGPKSGGTNSEEERGTFGSRSERGGEGGKSLLLLTRPWGLGERLELSLSEWGPGRSPGLKRFYCNLNSANGLCGQQILHLFVLKSGRTVPLSPKSGGTGTSYGKLRL